MAYYLEQVVYGWRSSYIASCTTGQVCGEQAAQQEKFHQERWMYRWPIFHDQNVPLVYTTAGEDVAAADCLAGGCSL